MWLFIEPNDVLLFRDGRPFVAGEDHRARSFFPPTPFTMQGVIRSRVLFDSRVSPYDYAHGAPSAQDLIRQIGMSGRDYGQLYLRGPFVAKRMSNGAIMRYFPLPADVVKVEDNYAVAHPLRDVPFSDNMPAGLRPLWVCTDKPSKEERGWLAEGEFQKYLAGQMDFCTTSDSDLFVRELRLGIALDYTRRGTQEGMLYQMEFLRLCEGVGLLLEVKGIEPLAQSGFLQLGGEARAATYEVLQTPPLCLPLPDPLPDRFKVILLTPAWFSGGWKPQSDDWRWFFNGTSVRLVAAALRRAQSIGGAFVDDRRRKGEFQKTMRRFVPAGSVYFFESEGKSTWNGVPFTETPNGEGDLGQIGFGCFIIAPWNDL